MPPERAFVVQFHQVTQSEPGWFGGRVEHVMSGQFSIFADSRELTAFFRRVLKTTSSAARETDGRNVRT